MLIPTTLPDKIDHRPTAIGDLQHCVVLDYRREIAAAMAQCATHQIHFVVAARGVAGFAWGNKRRRNFDIVASAMHNHGDRIQGSRPMNQIDELTGRVDRLFSRADHDVASLQTSLFRRAPRGNKADLRRSGVVGVELHSQLDARRNLARRNAHHADGPRQLARGGGGKELADGRR